MFKIEIYFGEDWEKTTGIYAQHYILDRRGATLTTYLSDDMREVGMVFDLIKEDVKLIFVDDEELYNKTEEESITQEKKEKLDKAIYALDKFIDESIEPKSGFGHIDKHNTIIFDILVEYIDNLKEELNID